MTSRRIVIITVALLGLVLGGAQAAAAQEPAKPGIVRDAEWHLRDSLTPGPGTTTFGYGRVDDVPFDSCDWDGNGTETPGVVRRVDGHWEWHLRNSNSAGPADIAFAYGLESDTPVCGDWDGNGTQTPGVVRFRPDNRFEWYLRNSNSGGTADVVFVYGRDFAPGTERRSFVLTGDWDGNGQDTVGVVDRREDGRFEWHLRNALAGGAADIRFVYYGGAVYGDHLAADIPLSGDWDADGQDTVGVARKREAQGFHWLLRNEHAAGPADISFVYGGPSATEWAVVWK